MWSEWFRDVGLKGSWIPRIETGDPICESVTPHKRVGRSG